MWKAGIASYAMRASHWRKKWIPYQWVVHLATELRRAILFEKDARIIVNAPPRHGKSEFTSHWVPTWFLDLFPLDEVILTSYGDSLASDWGRKVRDEFIMNENCWTELRSDSKAVGDWRTTLGGGMRTSGVGGPITGKGANLAIIDDPHKNWEDAMSQSARERLIDWFQSTLYTRAEPGAAIIVIQTRWHENDLTGYLLNEHEDDWKLLRYPAIAEEDDLLGRAPGEALCPERFTKERLEKIRKILGSYMWAGLYQQRPAPIEGGMIQRQWFKRFDSEDWNKLSKEDDELGGEWIQSWDLTFKSTGTSYVVGTVWKKVGANIFLMDRIRDKFDFPDTIKKMLLTAERWPQAVTKLIEDKANGPAVISTLEDKVQGILPYSPKGSKEARLASVSGLIEAGNVWIPDSSVCDWGDDFIEEVVNFPHSRNDDQVDSMTMALDRFKSSSNTFNINLNTERGAQSSAWRF